MRKICILIIAVLLLSGAAAYAEYVTADKLNVRASDSTNSALLDTLPRGAYVQVIKKSGDWSFISYVKANNQAGKGYVANKYLSTSPAVNVTQAGTKDGAYHFNSCAEAYSAGNYQRAIQDCTSAINKSYMAPPAYGIRANAKLYNKDYKNAIKDYDTAIMKGLNSALIYHYRGQAKFLDKDYLGALNDSNTALEKGFSPQEQIIKAGTYAIRGGAKLGLEDTYGALNDFNMAISLGINDPSIIETRDIVREKLYGY